MSALPGGVPRFNPTESVNFRALPTFNPYGTEAIAQAMSGLSGMFNQINNTVNHLQAKRVEFESEEAGKKAGAADGFNAKDLPDPYTVAGEAYRRGAMESFGTKLEMERQQAFTQYQLDYMKTPANQRDPMAFAARLNDWVEERASVLPEELALPFKQMAINKANPLVLNASQDQITYQQAAAKADKEAALELFESELLDNPLPANEMEQKAYDTSLVQYRATLDSLGLSDNEKALKIQSLTDKTREKMLMRSFELATDKVSFIEQFVEVDPKTIGIDSEQQNKLATAMQAEVGDKKWVEDQRIQKLSFDQELSIELAKNEIEDRVEKADIQEKDIISFAQKNPDKVATSWVGDQISALKKKREHAADTQTKMQQTIAGQIPIDQSDSATQKMVDDWYDIQMRKNQPVQNATVTGKFHEQRPGHLHDGVDFAAPQGSRVEAVMGGTVTFVGTRGGYGKVVEVLQDDGNKALYAHTSTQLVKQGQRVSGQQEIAKVGNTGNSSGPHLHLRLTGKDGKDIDPQKYLKAVNAGAPPNMDALATKAMAATGKAPRAYREQVVRMLHSSKISDQAEAASRYAYMMDHDVDFPGLSDRDKGLLMRINSEMKRGVSDDKAVEMARFETDPSNTNLIQANKERVKEILKKPDYQVDRVFGNEGGLFGWGRDVPTIPLMSGLRDNFKADLDTTFTQAFYQTGGDEQAAWTVTKRELAKTYGRSKVGAADVVTKYPAEKFYSLRGYTPEQNANWINKQLGKELMGKTMPAVSPKDVSLVVVPSSTRNGQKPVYMIQYRNEHGMFVPLTQKGRTVVWHPDTQAEIKRITAERQKQAQKQIEEAQALRQASGKTQPKPFNMLAK